MCETSPWAAIAPEPPLSGFPNMDDLFREVLVWRRLNDACAVRYTCFEDLAAARFAVSSADFFYLNDLASYALRHDRQKVELFIETPIRERCGWHASLTEAIAEHDTLFEGFP
jgi:hypothetical protein